MNNNYKSVLTGFIAAVVLFLAAGCAGEKYPPELGKNLRFLDSDLLYTNAVTKEEAVRLGEYLVKTGFFAKGTSGLVQLTKKDGIYQFRMVAKKEFLDDPEFLKNSAMFAAHISRDVFNGQKLDMYFCDKKLETLQVVSYNIK